LIPNLELLLVFWSSEKRKQRRREGEKVKSLRWGDEERRGKEEVGGWEEVGEVDAATFSV
jgi:hypothetical protein